MRKTLRQLQQTVHEVPVPRRHTSNTQIRVHSAWFLAAIFAALAARSDARATDPIAVIAAGGCKVWMQEPNGPEKLKASWTGKCDEQGFATGDGKLFKDQGYAGKDAFVGEMRAGRAFTGTYFQNSGSPCLPKQTSGQMTESARNTWFDSKPKGDYPCRNNNWLVQEMRLSGGKVPNYDDSVWYFGTDAERIAAGTGIAAFSANVRAQAPRKRDVAKAADDACAKTQIVNGKKLCVE